MESGVLRVISFLVGFVLLISIPAQALDEALPAAKKLKFRKISMPAGVTELEAVHDLVVLDKKSAVAFGIAKDKNNFWRLVGFRISSRGKAGSANIIDFLSAEVAAVWIPASQNIPAAAPYGLVFYGYRFGENLVIRVGKFDSRGQLTDIVRDLFEIQVPADHFFSNVDLTAAAGGQSIAVAFNLKSYAGNWDAPRETYAYVLETDFHGKLIGTATKVPFTNSGKDLIVSLRRPMPAGVNWMIPAILYNHETGELNAAVVQISKSKAKISTVYAAPPGGGLDAEGGNAQFLPIPSASGKGSLLPTAPISYDFLIHSYDGLPYDPLRMRTEDFFISIQRIKRTGKKAGSPYYLEADQWIPTLTPDINKRLNEHREFVSYAATVDGKLVMAKSRFLRRSWNGSPPVTMYDFEHELLLYSIDMKKGKTDVIASVKPNKDQTTNAPILAAGFGKVWVISLYKDAAEPGYAPYLSFF